MTDPVARLSAFANEEGFTRSRGALNLGLVLTRRAKEDGLPLDPQAQLAASGGQVKGLNGAAGNRILRDYGVTRSIGTEVGRTNRGSVDNMRRYVEFLNAAHRDGAADLDAFERFWVDQFVQRFASQPFKLRREAGLTVQQIVRDLIAQADARQAEAGGAMVTGTVLQHLVGAKLEVALAGRLTVVHHGANTSDVAGRGGDFDLGDTVVHVSTTPGDLLLAKCAGNIQAALRPIIVTTEDEVEVATKLARRKGLDERVEIYAVEQFVSINANELGLFAARAVADTLRAIIDRYNAIVKAHEIDPSLRIAW